jgi:hypothetical protein
MSKETKLAEIHQEAVLEFDVIQSALRNERLQCLQDRRFTSISGAQWEGPLGDQFENKPRFEVNKVHMSVLRICNEYRNNRITVSFASKENGDYDKLADTCAGLYRADEYDSGAQEAYDNAFEEAVTGGIGAWRLRTEYAYPEDADDEKQRICIEPIYDADSSVFWDLNSKRYDKSDAKRCFVLYSMTPAAYREEFNDDPASWPKTIQQLRFDWLTPDVVYVCEYYRIEEKKEVVTYIKSLMGEEKTLSEDEMEGEWPMYEKLGWYKVREKKFKKKKCHKYILSGNSILEDCGILAGNNIPIVPVYGKRWFVDNVERCMGHIRLAKDVQRLKNMQLSKLAEISAISSVEKPIFTPEQVAGHQVMWSEDNLRNFPYLLVNPLTDMNGNQQAAGPIAYTKSPTPPPAMAALLTITEADMQEVLGNGQNAEKMLSHVTGKAVDMIQNALSNQSFIYMDNMGRSIKRSGEIWLSMARDIFIESDRKMKSIASNGKVELIKLMQPTMNQDTGEIELENDMTKAVFDVIVEVGPTSSSKRTSTVKSLTGMMAMTQDPEMLKVLSSMIMMNMEGEGIGDVRDYFRKQLLRMGVVKPTEMEKQEMIVEMQNQTPSPENNYLIAAADKEATAAIKNRADTILIAAKADEQRAKALETLSKVDLNRLEIVQRAVPSLIPQGGITQAPQSAPMQQEQPPAMPQSNPQQ